MEKSTTKRCRAATAALADERLTGKALRRRLDHIEQQLAQLHDPSDVDIVLVKQHRPDLVPAVLLASCEVERMVDLLGYKPVMRALTKLMRQTLRRIYIVRKAQADNPLLAKKAKVKQHSITKPVLREDEPDPDDRVPPPPDELQDIVAADACPQS